MITGHAPFGSYTAFLLLDKPSFYPDFRMWRQYPNCRLRLWALTDSWALWVWGSWNRSYNLWIVHYLHVPHLQSVLIFTSVALWHDLSPRHLAWGWFTALFILSVVMARRALPSEVRPPQFSIDPSQLRMQAESPSSFCFSTLFSVCSLGNVAVSSCACCWRCL